MSLSDALASDLSAMLADFGELVVYYPRSGVPRAIIGNVPREPEQSIPGLQSGVAPLLTITVANDPVTGISSTEIDNGDQIEVALMYGGAPERRSIITPLISQDAGAITFGVR